MTDNRDHSDDAELAAAEWVVRLGAGPLGAEDRRAFDAWLASPDHAAAFKQAQAAWGQMGKLASAPGSLARHSVHARDAKPSISVPSIPARRRRSAPLAAMAASVAIAVGVS
ncbi:MAG: FecR/PupR family sigma factor regulator, partial [Sphingobium sp.]